jgi:carboxyl-terminal processing protease
MTEEEEMAKAKAEREAKISGKDDITKDPQLEAAVNAIHRLAKSK